MEDEFTGCLHPTHEEHDHFLEWCGGSFDPAAFDLVLANQRRSQLKF
ncbi:plasmid pRiA4b ORF-3 family protein [Pandoraea sputorum]|nr:plasmid pRiA4b ORF-3 family protein [Pandoraea sputorum]